MDKNVFFKALIVDYTCFCMKVYDSLGNLKLNLGPFIADKNQLKKSDPRF